MLTIDLGTRFFNNIGWQSNFIMFRQYNIPTEALVQFDIPTYKPVYSTRVLSCMWYVIDDHIKSIAMNMSLFIFQSLVDMAPKYILEQFLEAELLINITEHHVSTVCN